MLHKLRNRAADQKGFTLIELLVVILIIGILAAIALPTFLGQQTKGQDSSAKSDARNTVSQMESCYTDKQTYENCPTATLPPGVSAVPTVGALTTDYTVKATSKSNNTFSIVKSTGGYARSCTVVGGDAGGCNVATGAATGDW